MGHNMNNILTICLNPSIDRKIFLDEFKVGELNRTKMAEIDFAGKGLNVASTLKKLGENVTLSGFMFLEDKGQFEDKLLNEDIEYSFVYAEGRARNNIKITSGNTLTEINESGNEVSTALQEELIYLVEKLVDDKDGIILSGSLPCGVSDSYYFSLIENVSPKTKIIVDTEGEKLLNCLKKGIYLIKPNLYELESIVNEKLKTKKDMVKSCRTLIEKGAENVLLSLGENGALLVNERESFYAPAPKIDCKYSVGAGDKMLAAAVRSLLSGSSLKSTVRRAVAYGTYYCAYGDESLDENKLEELISKIKSIRI